MKPLFPLVILLILSACGGQQDLEQAEILRPVKYAKVNNSDGGEVHTFSGVAQSALEADLSFRVAGTVRTVNVKLGDRVRKGQLIATLDPTDYNIQAEQVAASEKGTEANLQSAENQLIIARSNYQRIEKLYENNNVPLSEFEQAKSNYETAQASFEAAKTQVTSANSQLTAARNQVNYTRLVAPFSGVITAVNIEANELVGSGFAVAVLSSEDGQEVNVGIPENFIASIKKGQKVSVHFSVLEDQNFTGTIQELSYAAGNSPTYPAIIALDKASAAIRPGMAATVSFTTDGEAGKTYLICPVASVGEDADGNFAFVLKTNQEGSHTVEKRQIKIGQLLADGFEVVKGLEENELVATAGLRSLLDEMKVKLLEE